MFRTLKTAAGSTVTLAMESARVDFDWFEEDNACIDCEVDVDLSRATGWKHLMWRCGADENHDLSFARLHPVEDAMQMIEDAGPRPRTTFLLTMRPEPSTNPEPKKVTAPKGLLLPVINPGTIDRLVRASITSRQK